MTINKKIMIDLNFIAVRIHYASTTLLNKIKY